MQRVDSTNIYASKLIAEKNAQNKTVIFAHEQFAGKGQKNSAWESKSHLNLTFSIIFFPKKITAQQVFQLNKVISLAVRQYVSEKLPSSKVQVKWPNDILVNRKKIAGILVENQINADKIASSVIGIGLNVNQKQFARFEATSLFLETERLFNTREELLKFLVIIDLYLENLSQKSAIDSEYLANLYLLNELAEFQIGQDKTKATICGVDEFGRLSLQIDDKFRHFDIKELRFLS